MSKKQIGAGRAQNTVNLVRPPGLEPAHQAKLSAPAAYRHAQFSAVGAPKGGRPQGAIADLLALQRTVGNRGVQRMVAQRTGNTTGSRHSERAKENHGIQIIARQPAPANPGWSDAPEKGLNKGVTTVDEKGAILPGKVASATSKGVWRVPIQDLAHGFGGTDKGSAFEAPEKRAVALIPSTMSPAAPGKSGAVAVDVLLHLHGHGVGFRELRPGKHDAPNVLQPGQARDMALYQMEQQLLSHVAASKRFVIAVLPQGSEKSAFGDLSANSDAYLKDVFNKLVMLKYLPQAAAPGRVTVSGHSGGGPTAMAVANQLATAGKRIDVLLFDAINFGCKEKEPVIDKEGKPVTDKEGKPVMKCKRCTSNEYTTVSNWVKARIAADVQNLTGKPEDQQKDLQANGARLRAFTSQALTTSEAQTCSYGYWYGKLKNEIDATITKLKVSDAVRNQFRQNYQVRQVQGSHEHMMGQGNLEAALKG